MPAPRTTIDPNVKIPNAIRKQAEAADAAFHAAAGTTPAPIAPVAPVAPVVTEVVPPVTPEVTPPAAPQDWEHAFKSMKGRYESSQNNIRNMSDQMTAMQQQLVALQSAQPVVAPNELLAASLLTPEETNEYGDEFLNVVGKKALEKVSPEITALKKELARISGKLEGDSAAQSVNARNAMNTALDDALPSWRNVNVAPEFHSWLQLPDPFSGAIRHSLLSAAYEQNNTPRVLAFFNGFLAQEAASDPAPKGGEPDPTVLETGKIPLETFAAPGRAKTSAAPGAPAEKPILSHAQVAQFYAAVAAGKYRGREAEKDRLDAMVVDAGRDGRIR